MPIYTMRWITRAYVQKHREFVFVFGDNDAGVGLGGQAKAMRGEVNALGIRTKKLPSLEENAFYTDDEYEENVRKIAEDIAQIKRKLTLDRTVIFPANGIGSGLSDLEKRAPKTYKYLQDELKNLFMEHYDGDERFIIF